MVSTTRSKVGSLLFASAVLVGCGDAAMEPSLGSQAAPIIEGSDERGYPAVGALIEPGFLGLSPQHKCTSVLIKPTWVLTAAHCLKGDPDLSWSVGPESRSGQRFEIAETITHPRYDDNPIGSLYDVALVRLSSPVPGNVATPMAYNTTDLEAFVGEQTLYVGYGSTSGTSGFLGVGRKRRTSVPIERVDRVTYSHGFDGTGVCFGDSGGPGLIEINGTETVVGVVSAALGCQGGTCDPCTNGSKATRIDRFADWIAHHIGDAFESCADDTERCVCAEACGGDGICDHAVCGAESCGEVLDCLFTDCADSPDGSCSTWCVEKATPSARQTLRPLVNCWGENCRKVPGSANEQACIEMNCGSQWQTCQAHVNPDGTPEPIDNGPAGPEDPSDPEPMEPESDAGPSDPAPAPAEEDAGAPPMMEPTTTETDPSTASPGMEPAPTPTPAPASGGTVISSRTGDSGCSLSTRADATPMGALAMAGLLLGFALRRGRRL